MKPLSYRPSNLLARCGTSGPPLLPLVLPLRESPGLNKGSRTIPKLVHSFLLVMMVLKKLFVRNCGVRRMKTKELLIKLAKIEKHMYSR